MEEQNVDSLQRKTIDLLNLFNFQNDYKYRFKPDVFNFMINTRDKSIAYLPKSVKYFKKILKTRNVDSKTKLKIKFSSKKEMLNDLKKMKRIQDEQNVYDALQEATVLDRISALKKKGIWTRECLPKVLEPQRNVCHWDYLLQEIEIMSDAFNSRLRFKVTAAKMLATSAKEYVTAKKEIERLESIQMHHQGRIRCSIIAKLIKDWWSSKDDQKCSQRTNPYVHMKMNQENNVMDYCQMWLTNSLINAECDDSNDQCFSDKSDSDSLCSFSSGVQSVMLIEEDLIKSVDNEYFEYQENCFNYEELTDELQWLVDDSNNSNCLEIKHSFDNEIDELNALSQIPLEDIVDQSYYQSDIVNENYACSSMSDSFDNESICSQLLSDDIIISNIRLTKNAIILNCEKLKSLLVTENNRFFPCFINEQIGLNKYLNNYSIKQNVQLLSELVNKNVTFSMQSISQCGDDRFIITVLLGYFSRLSSVEKCSTLLITTIGMIPEWCKLLTTICPKVNIVLLDSYLNEQQLDHVLCKISTSVDVICITSYGTGTKFTLSDIHWTTVIYDHLDQYCQCALGNKEVLAFDNIYCERKIALLSDYKESLNDMNALNLYFRILYSSDIYMELLQDFQTKYTIKSEGGKALVDKLKRIAVKHIVPLPDICNFDDSYCVIMCELSPIQQTLHEFVINKLKRSLDSSSLLDIIEVVSQDIQISQHPTLFDHLCGDTDTAIYNTMLKDCDSQLLDISYNCLSLDTIECYIPQPVSLMLKDSWINDYNWLSNEYKMLQSMKCKMYKVERIRLGNLLISSANIDTALNKVSLFSNENNDLTNIFNRNPVKIENSFYPTETSPFLSSNDLKRLKLEDTRQRILSTGGVAVNKNYNFQSLYKEHNNIDKEASVIITSHNTKIKHKLELTRLCKENDIFTESLLLEDSSYPYIADILYLDMNINNDEIGALQTLTSITKCRVASLLTNFDLMEHKVSAKSPKLLTRYGRKTPFTNLKTLQAITTFYRNFFSSMPRPNKYFFKASSKKLLMSGKLRTLHTMFREMVNDTLTKKYIVVSHSFDFLNMIESLLYLNNNYNGFKRLRLNASLNEDEKISFSIIEYFNMCHRRNKKVVLLLHSKCDPFILDRIDASFSSIILTDSHWQTDSDLLVKKLITRWHLNCIISSSSISSIYRLCSFGSLEQFFLTNNLLFIYDNTYINKTSINSTSGAIICQQSLLKNFVDKLPSPLKEDLISGFYVDDFQSVLQSNDDYIKLAPEAVCEIFNSFENPYDMAHKCHYQALNKMENYELSHAAEIINKKFCHFPKPLYFLQNYNFHIDGASEKYKKESYKSWELCRVERSEKLKHLRKLTECNEFQRLCDTQKVDSIDLKNTIMPLCIDDNSRYIPREIKEMYELEPIPDTDLSLHLLPTKLYHTKDPTKVEKTLLPKKIAEDNLNVNISYSDTERVKKRKYSSDSYSLGEINQFNKKRRILTNRRYFGEHELDLSNNRVHLKSRIRLEKKGSNEREVKSFELKESNEVIIKKQPVDEVEQNSVELESAMFQSTVPSVPCSQSNITTQVNDGNRFNSVVITAISGSIKVNLQRPFYSREGWKIMKSKRQHLTSGTVSNLTTKSCVAPSVNIQSYLGQQRLLYNRGKLSSNVAPFVSQPEVTSQSNSESEYEKLPDWSLHEEAVLYQNITQHQDYQCSTNVLDKFLPSPNFKLCEHYMNFYAISNNHRSSEMCKIHFNKLQTGYSNQNSVANNISRTNKNQTLTNPTAAKKLKMRMRNSIGTYGTSNFGCTQPSTSKVKMFQHFLNDMKVNIVQTYQIVNSSLSSFDNMSSITSKMLDEVVNKSRLPSLLPNHSQTIKKNATHMNALEEHSIHPDKIFTPAMLIQRREDLDKERESETVHSTSNLNRQIITPVSTNYRSPAYFEGTQLNTSSNPLSHIRRSASTNIGASQNIYSIQAPVGNQVRARYNLPINRQMSGATVIHQPGVSQTSSSLTGGMTNNNNCNSATTSLSQNQVASINQRNQIQHLQIQQPNRNNTASTTTTSRRPVTNQPQVMSRLIPYTGPIQNYPFVRQNLSGNRQSNTNNSSFARPIVSTVLGNQSTNQNMSSGVNNQSIITVFPNSSHDQSGLTMVTNNANNSANRLSGANDRSINVSQHIRGQSIRTSSIPSVSNRTNAIIGGQMPRMMVNNNNRHNNPNTGGKGRNQD